MLCYFISQTTIHSHNLELSLVNSAPARPCKRIIFLFLLCMYAKSDSKNKCDVLKARTSTLYHTQREITQTLTRATKIHINKRKKTTKRRLVQSRCHCGTRKSHVLSGFIAMVCHLMGSIFFNLETTIDAKVHVQCWKSSCLCLSVCFTKAKKKKNRTMSVNERLLYVLQIISCKSNVICPAKWFIYELTPIDHNVVSVLRITKPKEKSSKEINVCQPTEVIRNRL